MKIDLFLLYISFSGLLSNGLEPSTAEKNSSKPALSSSNPDQRAILSEESVESPSRKASNDETSSKQDTIEEKESGASDQIITKKIKSIFEDFIKTLENRSVESDEYRKAVKIFRKFSL